VFRHGLLPAIHSLVSGLLGSVVGFGVATLILGGASGTVAGIGAVAVINEAGFVVTGKGFDLSRVRAPWETEEEHVWRGCLWILSAAGWLAIGVPVSAYLAPDYALHGVVANVITIALVPGASYAVYKASPWRDRWRRT
jgi:hypothetical protein